MKTSKRQSGGNKQRRGRSWPKTTPSESSKSRRRLESRDKYEPLDDASLTDVVLRRYGIKDTSLSSDDTDPHTEKLLNVPDYCSVSRPRPTWSGERRRDVPSVDSFSERYARRCVNDENRTRLNVCQSRLSGNAFHYSGSDSEWPRRFDSSQNRLEGYNRVGLGGYSVSDSINTIASSNRFRHNARDTNASHLSDSYRHPTTTGDYYDDPCTSSWARLRGERRFSYPYRVRPDSGGTRWARPTAAYKPTLVSDRYRSSPSSWRRFSSAEGRQRFRFISDTSSWVKDRMHVPCGTCPVYPSSRSRSCDTRSYRGAALEDPPTTSTRDMSRPSRLETASPSSRSLASHPDLSHPPSGHTSVGDAQQTNFSIVASQAQVENITGSESRPFERVARVSTSGSNSHLYSRVEAGSSVDPENLGYFSLFGARAYTTPLTKKAISSTNGQDAEETSVDPPQNRLAYLTSRLQVKFKDEQSPESEPSSPEPEIPEKELRLARRESKRRQSKVDPPPDNDPFIRTWRAPKDCDCDCYHGNQARGTKDGPRLPTFKKEVVLGSARHPFAKSVLPRRGLEGVYDDLGCVSCGQLHRRRGGEPSRSPRVSHDVDGNTTVRQTQSTAANPVTTDLPPTEMTQTGQPRNSEVFKPRTPAASVVFPGEPALLSESLPPEDITEHQPDRGELRTSRYYSVATHQSGGRRTSPVRMTCVDTGNEMSIGGEGIKQDRVVDSWKQRSLSAEYHLLEARWAAMTRPHLNPPETTAYKAIREAGAPQELDTQDPTHNDILSAQKRLDEGISKPVNEDIPRSVNEDISKPVNEDISKPENEDISKPVNEEISKPVEEDFKKSVNEGIQRKVNEGVSKPVNEGVSKPVNEGVSKPVNEGVSKPVNEGVSKPVNEGVSKPVNEGVSKPVNEDILESVKEDFYGPGKEDIHRSVNEHTPEQMNKDIQVLVDKEFRDSDISIDNDTETTASQQQRRHLGGGEYGVEAWDDGARNVSRFRVASNDGRRRLSERSGLPSTAATDDGENQQKEDVESTTSRDEFELDTKPRQFENESRRHTHAQETKGRMRLRKDETFTRVEDGKSHYRRVGSHLTFADTLSHPLTAWGENIVTAQDRTYGGTEAPKVVPIGTLSSSEEVPVRDKEPNHDPRWQIHKKSGKGGQTALVMELMSDSRTEDENKTGESMRPSNLVNGDDKARAQMDGQTRQGSRQVQLDGRQTSQEGEQVGTPATEHLSVEEAGRAAEARKATRQEKDAMRHSGAADATQHGWERPHKYTFSQGESLEAKQKAQPNEYQTTDQGSTLQDEGPTNDQGPSLQDEGQTTDTGPTLQDEGPTTDTGPTLQDEGPTNDQGPTIVGGAYTDSHWGAHLPSQELLSTALEWIRDSGMQELEESLLHHLQQVGNTRQPTTRFNIPPRKGLYMPPQAYAANSDSDEEACPCETCECKAPLPGTVSYSYPWQRRESTAGRVIMCRPRQAKPAEEHPGPWVDSAGESKAAQTDVNVKSQSCGCTISTVPLRPDAHAPQEDTDHTVLDDQFTNGKGQGRTKIASVDQTVPPDQKTPTEAEHDKTTPSYQKAPVEAKKDQFASLVLDLLGSAQAKTVTHTEVSNTYSSGRSSRSSISHGSAKSSGSNARQSFAAHSHRRRSTKSNSTPQERGDDRKSILSMKLADEQDASTVARKSAGQSSSQADDKRQSVASSAVANETNIATADVEVNLEENGVRPVRSETDVDRPYAPVPPRHMDPNCHDSVGSPVDPPMVHERKSFAASWLDEDDESTPSSGKKRAGANRRSKAYGLRKQSEGGDSSRKSYGQSRKSSVKPMDAFGPLKPFMDSLGDTIEVARASMSATGKKKSLAPERRGTVRISKKHSATTADIFRGIRSNRSSITMTESESSETHEMVQQSATKVAGISKSPLGQSFYVGSSATVLRNKPRGLGKPRGANNKWQTLFNKTRDASRRSNIVLDATRVPSGKSLSDIDKSLPKDVDLDAPVTGESNTHDGAAAGETGKLVVEGVLDTRRHKQALEKMLQDKTLPAAGVESQGTHRKLRGSSKSGDPSDEVDVAPRSKHPLNRGDDNSERWSQKLMTTDGAKSKLHVSSSSKPKPVVRDYEALQRAKCQGHAATYKSPASLSIDMKRMFKRKVRTFEPEPGLLETISKREKAKGYLRKITQGYLTHAVDWHLRRQAPPPGTSRRDMIVAGLNPDAP